MIFSGTSCLHPYDGYICLYHLHSSTNAKHLPIAVLASGVNKQVRAHTFGHSFATNVLRNGTVIRTVQELLDHADIRTEEIYTHVVGNLRAGTASPMGHLPLV